MDPYIGQIIIFAGNFAPRGWQLCNGQLLSISQYTALYSILGTVYGGDGRTTFALPNLQSRVPIHAGQGQGLSSYVPGAVGGVESVTLTTGQIPPHVHPEIIAADASPGTTASPNGGNIAQVQDPNQANPFDSFTTGAPTNPATLNAGMTGAAGGGGNHENRQPYLALNYIIAVEGIFPPRP